MLKEFPFHLKLTKMKQLVVLSLKLYFSFEAPKKKNPMKAGCIFYYYFFAGEQGQLEFRCILNHQCNFFSYEATTNL
jgi:hypothetical protein